MKPLCQKSISLLLILTLLAVYSAFPGSFVSAASVFESAKADYEAAVTAEQEAKGEYDQAQTYYDLAVQKKTDADSAVATATAALDDAKKAASKKVSEIQSDAAADVQKKQTLFDTADTDLTAAKKAASDAKSELETAEANYDKDALDKAVQDAEKAVSDAEEALQNAKDAEAAAQQKYDNAGRDFLSEKAGEAVSVDILTDLFKQNSELQQYVTTEKYEKALSSALTVDNLKKAADFVTECNELRAQYHSLPALKINYRLMCLSATSAAVSSQVVDHAVINQIYGSNNPETDPIWAVGWDDRSVILMLLDGGAWTAKKENLSYRQTFPI